MTDFEQMPLGTKQKMEELQKEVATLLHEFKMLQSGAHREHLACEQLRVALEQSQAREAVLVEALQEMMRMNQEIFGNHLFAAFRAGKDDFRKAWINAEHALANTSEQAKALIAIVEALRKIPEIIKYIETKDGKIAQVPMRDLYEVLLYLAAYDKLKEGK